MNLSPRPLRGAFVGAAAAALAAGAIAAGADPVTARPIESAPSAGTTTTGTPAAGARAMSQARVEPAAAAVATWSNRQVARELVLAGVDMGSLGRARKWAKSGIGGLVLFGTPPRSLGAQLAAVRGASPQGRILVSSDEEGGSVQRLARLLGRLPSARQIGLTQHPGQAAETARRYGTGMKSVGVNVDLAPVADVAEPGSYIFRDGRSFSTDPARAGRHVTAWLDGLRQAGVMGVVKHWPGHGSAANTHVGAGRTPAWSQLLKHDEIPFEAAFAARTPAVMVGHLTVPGLTERRTPASLSPTALAYLRAAAGPETLIMTDSLAMGAVTTSMRQSVAQAAVRSLRAGADVALVNGVNPMAIARAIEAALNDGRLPRAQALASAARTLTAQLTWR